MNKMPLSSATWSWIIKAAPEAQSSGQVWCCTHLSLLHLPYERYVHVRESPDWQADSKSPASIGRWPYLIPYGKSNFGICSHCGNFYAFFWGCVFRGWQPGLNSISIYSFDMKEFFPSIKVLSSDSCVRGQTYKRKIIALLQIMCNSDIRSDHFPPVDEPEQSNYIHALTLLLPGEPGHREKELLSSVALARHRESNPVPLCCEPPVLPLHHGLPLSPYPLNIIPIKFPLDLAPYTWIRTRNWEIYNLLKGSGHLDHYCHPDTFFQVRRNIISFYTYALLSDPQSSR